MQNKTFYIKNYLIFNTYYKKYLNKITFKTRKNTKTLRIENFILKFSIKEK